jgi:hypothetical protein
MLKTKEKEVGKGKIPADVMEAAKEQIEKLTENIDNEVFETHNISRTFYQQWIETKGNIPEISQIRERIEANFEKLLKVQKPELVFDYPKELNKQVYVKFIKAAYEKFRFDIYHH